MEKIPCRICPKTFRNPSGLKWHMSNIHVNDSEPRGPTTGDKFSFEVEGFEPQLNRGETVGVAQADTSVEMEQITPEVDSLRKDAAQRQQANDAESLKIEFDQAQVRIRELEEQIEINQVLKNHLVGLQFSSQERDQLIGQIKELETQLALATQAQETSQTSIDEWQKRSESEQAARQQMQRQIEAHQAQNATLSNEIPKLNDQIRESEESSQRLFVELKELMPLKVWSGHPCNTCKKPMSGAVESASASRLLQDFSHAECLKNNDLIMITA